MNRDFTSFSTVFQSYQDNERSIILAVGNKTPSTAEKIFVSRSSLIRIWAAVLQNGNSFRGNKSAIFIFAYLHNRPHSAVGRVPDS